MKQLSTTYGKYVISRSETGTITIKKNGQLCNNAIDAIRTIAKECGFPLEPQWNTQTAGAKLISFLLSKEKDENTREVFLYLPGYEYDHDEFAEAVENEETENYEDDMWGLMSDVEHGDIEAEKVSSINLEKPGLYIKDLERRTYAYVFDGEIVIEYS